MRGRSLDERAMIVLAARPASRRPGHQQDITAIPHRHKTLETRFAK
jgi:hypothetical protein